MDQCMGYILSYVMQDWLRGKQDKKDYTTSYLHFLMRD